VVLVSTSQCVYVFLYPESPRHTLIHRLSAQNYNVESNYLCRLNLPQHHCQKLKPCTLLFNQYSTHPHFLAKRMKIKIYNCVLILQSFETCCPTLRASGVSEQWRGQYSNQRLQLQLWHVGNYTLQCFVFCNSSCSSASFTTLRGLWLSPSDHSKSCYSTPVISNHSRSSASYDHTHLPAIVFLVFLSVCSPLVSILIFNLPFFNSP
jgi:hypothetical protein